MYDSKTFVEFFAMRLTNRYTFPYAKIQILVIKLLLEEAGNNRSFSELSN